MQRDKINHVHIEPTVNRFVYTSFALVVGNSTYSRSLDVAAKRIKGSGVRKSVILFSSVSTDVQKGESPDETIVIQVEFLFVIYGVDKKVTSFIVASTQPASAL